MIITLLLLGWAVSSLLCAGWMFADVQDTFPNIAKEMRRNDLGLALCLGMVAGLVWPVGVIHVFCMTGFRQHGWRLW